MDSSTDGVTLYAVFINDILKNYEAKKDDYLPLFSMAAEYDLSSPFNKIPIQVYNNMCEWIETELGKFNLIRVGRNIGETAYSNMVENGLIGTGSNPFKIMEALVKVASEMIQDPKQRGWEIIKTTPQSILLRRTQSFNRHLQLGLLDGLIRKSGAMGVKVDFVQSIDQGAEFDEYLVSWNVT